MDTQNFVRLSSDMHIIPTTKAQQRMAVSNIRLAKKAPRLQWNTPALPLMGRMPLTVFGSLGSSPVGFQIRSVHLGKIHHRRTTWPIMLIPFEHSVVSTTAHANGHMKNEDSVSHTY